MSQLPPLAPSGASQALNYYTTSDRMMADTWHCIMFKAPRWIYCSISVRSRVERKLTWRRDTMAQQLGLLWWLKVRNENLVCINCGGNNDSGNNFKLISAQIKVEYLLLRMAVVLRKRDGQKKECIGPLAVNKSGTVVEWGCDSGASAATNTKKNNGIRIGFAWSMAKGNS